jgi:hypothetical protein
MLQWGVPLTAAQGCQPLDATIDGSGDLVVSGFCTGGTAFAGNVSVPATGVGTNSAFLVQIASSNGTVRHVLGDSTGSSVLNCVAADSVGSTVYVAGTFAGPSTLGSLVLTQTPTTGFLATVGANLMPTASSTLGADPGTGGLGLTRVVPGCPLIAAGGFHGALTLPDGPHSGGTASALFVAGYDALSGGQWAVTFPSGDAFNTTVVTGLSVDRSAGAYYLTGAYKTSIMIGSSPQTETDTNGAGVVLKLE